MIEPTAVILKNGKQAIYWTGNEKPNVNQWYQCIEEPLDYWKITKDYYRMENKTTYYKIVEYYNGDILYSGYSLKAIRQLIRENTYRRVY